MTYSNELYHHGIKGQKWGVRRFQNRDGSYTALGARRRTGTFEPTAAGKSRKHGLATRMLRANGKRYRARLEKEMTRMQKKKKYRNADRKDRNFQAAAARRMAVRSVLTSYATYKVAKLAYNMPKYIRFAKKVKRVVNNAQLMNASMNVVMEQFPDGSTRFV